MQVCYEQGLFYCISSYEERFTPKEAGFRWNVKEKRWETTNSQVAEKLKEFFNGSALESLNLIQTAEKTTIEDSMKSSSDFQVPAPEGLAYLPYQRAGIEYMAGRPNCLLCDEMGLGKTIQGLGYINLFRADLDRILVVCPASLKYNWQSEAEKWIIDPYQIDIISNPDQLKTEGIKIINYDILSKFKDDLNLNAWDLIIFDEAHKMKSAKAIRSKIGLAIPGKRKIFMTGTPILNRPKEIYTMLKSVDPDMFGNWFKFVMRYCDGKQTKYGIDDSGASNLEELQFIIRSRYYVRRLKSEVLKELPEKRRSVVILPVETKELKKELAEENSCFNHELITKIKAEIEISKLSDDDSAYKAAVEKLRSEINASFTMLAKLRYQTAIKKVPMMVEYVNELLESTDKVVIFAHHHDVINSLQEEFADQAVKLTGEMNLEDRNKSVNRFQNDDSVKVFIGSIQAAGVGLTLTKASNVIFGELDWTPGNMIQAEDRCHRIGQKNAVNIYHLVLDGSIDIKISKQLIKKQEIIERALDCINPNDLKMQAEPSKDEDDFVYHAEESEFHKTKKTDWDSEPDLSPELISKIQTDLRLLAGLDFDNANIKNDMGFNKIDTCIGKELALLPSLTQRQAKLAKRILKKYWKQTGNKY